MSSFQAEPAEGFEFRSGLLVSFSMWVKGPIMGLDTDGQSSAAFSYVLLYVTLLFSSTPS